MITSRASSTAGSQHLKSCVYRPRDTSGVEEKYRKRLRQKQEERRFAIVMMMLCLLVLLLSGVLLHLIHQYYEGTSATPKDGAKSMFSIPLPNVNLRPPKKLGKDEDHPAFRKLEDAEQGMVQNSLSEISINPKLLVSLEKDEPNVLLQEPMPLPTSRKFSRHGQFFRISRLHQRMAWQDEWDKLKQEAMGNWEGRLGPKVDYTKDNLYQYPEKLLDPPTKGYPHLRPLQDLFTEWPQHEIDRPPTPIVESLQVFDFATELDAALAYRERRVPFKLRNVPELIAADRKWTDEYVASNFDSKKAQGKCQESRHAYFAFFQPTGWNVLEMGLPPTRNNDWTFERWAEHARYADAVGLHVNRPHFYWQSGVPKEEREVGKKSWSFVSRDLPSFSSPNTTFISSSPLDQKGIQCRFGERGVTAATHYDAGQNMVGMISGAKRYVLLPPNQCSEIGVVTSRNSALFRHSLLYFGYIGDVEEEKYFGKLSPEERAWMDRARRALAVETVLKAGEVLFIPSHWFHYIVSLQKNAQCNVRSGVEVEGDEEFGGQAHVVELCTPK